MIDSKKEISLFVKNNFQPQSSKAAEYLYTSEEFLNLLFNTFPQNCIDSYELYEILCGLGYSPQKIKDKDKLKIVWAFSTK